MKLRELLRDIPVTAIHANLDTEIGDVSYDSRSTKPGDLFVAVRGFETDGHRYIPMALEKGAAAVLCEDAPGEKASYILTGDSRLALAVASRNYFGDPASRMAVIGVTGTNGKTTSTLLLKHVLEDTLGAKVGLIGTNGNLIGDREIPSERTTPESYVLQKLFREMADEGCTHAVMEVSSHALDQYRVAGFRFAAGVFTNLTQDHLDYHGTMEAYAAAKARFFPLCAKAALNLDDAWAGYYLDRGGCPMTGFGIASPAAELRGTDIRLFPDRVSFRAVRGGEAAEVNLGIPGRFSVYNALGVLACAGLLGIPQDRAAASLATARGVRGRVEPVPTAPDYTVLIDYAHTPDALENVLRTVRESAQGRVVALFGCGGDRDRKKRPIMGKIGTELSDFAVITSDNPRTEDPGDIIREIVAGVTVPESRYAVIPDRREAIAWALEHHEPGDVIVLAGKGHETYQEINHVKYPMDEREIVRKIRERRKDL